MEINEKLEIFSKAAIDAATMQSESILEEQKTAYQAEITAYRQKKQEQWEEREHILGEKVRKEVNREVSGQLMATKRKYHEAEEEKKDMIFKLAEQKIAEYRKSDAYYKDMCKLIEGAKREAGSESFTVYISAEDEGILDRLTHATKSDITVTKEKLGGGIRAVIPSKNIMIDETYATKLKRERETFVLA
jgi:vacuolar-type H+-ATPase subunit E/Vma4